jgi:DNA-binding SARP family transcriptional activator
VTELRRATPTIDLSAYLLGLPIVEQGGQRLDIPRREVRALLYCLAARLEPASREQLCFLFWPDSPDALARRALSHLLTHLRMALNTSAAILTWDDHVGLEPSQVRADTLMFEQLINSHTGNGQVEILQRAVELYRGPFLSGFSLQTSPEFETWQLQERRDWERRYLETLAVLIEAKSASGEYTTAIKYAHRYLAANDLAEEIHRQLIELYAAIGDRASAMRQFETCAAVLGRDLAISPQPLTWATYQIVVEGGSPLARRSR